MKPETIIKSIYDATLQVYKECPDCQHTKVNFAGVIHDHFNHKEYLSFYFSGEHYLCVEVVSDGKAVKFSFYNEEIDYKKLVLEENKFVEKCAYTLDDLKFARKIMRRNCNFDRKQIKEHDRKIKLDKIKNVKNKLKTMQKEYKKFNQ